MIPNVNLVHFTDRRELFTNRIPLSSVRTVLTDRKTVNTHSCHENILSPTNEMRFTDRKTHFTDRIPLLSICSIRTDRQTVYSYSCHKNILSRANQMRFTDRKKSLQTVYHFCRSVRCVRIDKPYITTLAMKIF